VQEIKSSRRGITGSSSDNVTENEQLPTSCETVCRILLELVDLMIKKRLSIKQLKYLAKVKENDGLLFYQLVNKLSNELHLPKSTVKWNLSRLRESGMIVAGSKSVKGVPVRLTEKWKITLLIMERGSGLLDKNFCPKNLFKTK